MRCSVEKSTRAGVWGCRSIRGQTSGTCSDCALLLVGSQARSPWRHTLTRGEDALFICLGTCETAREIEARGLLTTREGRKGRHCSRVIGNVLCIMHHCKKSIDAGIPTPLVRPFHKM